MVKEKFKFRSGLVAGMLCMLLLVGGCVAVGGYVKQREKELRWASACCGGSVTSVHSYKVTTEDFRNSTTQRHNYRKIMRVVCITNIVDVTGWD